MKTVPRKKTLIDKEIQTSEQTFEKEQDQQQGEEYERAGEDDDEFGKEDEIGGEKLQALRQDNENLQSQIEELETQLHDRNLEFEKMKASIETTRPDDLVEAGTDLARVEELERDRDELRMKCEVLEKKNQGMLMDLDRGRNFEFQNKSLNSEIKALNEAMEKRVPVLRFNFKDIHYPPVTIVMTDVDHFKKNKFQWFSPGFYSHPGGYKLCLKVCAAGHEEGEGSHVSAYVHVMAGDNDDKLGWPFRGEVEVQLLNRQADENHKTVVVTFDDSSLEKVCSRVFGGLLTDAGMAARSGEGAPKLILQSDLRHNRIAGTEYLRDDSLFFCVTRVQVDASTAVPQAISTPTTENVLTFRVKGYSKLKSKNGKFPSEPFYTHKQGYKFVLVVHPNGEYAYRGKSVSVFAHLMRGDYDDNLKFPFRGAITVQVVNQREENNHVEFPIEFNETNDPKGQRGARVSRISLDNIIAGHSTDGWGYANFIQHDHLYYNKYRNTQYLTDNDEIVFRVTKVDVFSK